jgi:TRAP-type C4-dicarboxylate transport system permease small subunit
MHRFLNIFERITRGCTLISSAFLIAVMLIIVANVVVRFFGRIIPGHYELVSLLIVVSVAFTLSYTALHQGHIAMKLIISRVSRRKQIIIGAVTTILSIVVWGAITWASIAVINEKGLSEVSNMLLIPYLPFRCVWVLGLSLFCLVLLSDLLKVLFGNNKENDFD